MRRFEAIVDYFHIIDLSWTDDAYSVLRPWFALHNVRSPGRLIYSIVKTDVSRASEARCISRAIMLAARSRFRCSCKLAVAYELLRDFCQSRLYFWRQTPRIVIKRPKFGGRSRRWGELCDCVQVETIFRSNILARQQDSCQHHALAQKNRTWWCLLNIGSQGSRMILCPSNNHSVPDSGRTGRGFDL